MGTPEPSVRRPHRAAIALFALLLVALLPSTASALTLKIVNESEKHPDEVFVTVSATGTYEVTGMENDVPKRLSEIPEGKIEIEKLDSGRIFIAYGAGVTLATTFASSTRFDWAELTVTPVPEDVANLTAVDQFGIGMHLETFDSSDKAVEAVGAANSNTIFDALQQIPGGPEATVRGAGNEILRVLSPNKTDVYPDLGDYVRSLAGQTITLRTAYFHKPFTTSLYSGTFGPDGTITLAGTSTTDKGAETSSSFTIPGDELIEHIYTGGDTPNTLEGAMKRDILAGFSIGMWGGRYGNDALDFCSNPTSNPYGTWCPEGFNQPAFGDARLSLAPYATCEQYAAVINQYSDVYGNPYSDAAKRVTVSLDQTPGGHDVKTLQLTVQPDEGDDEPVSGGNPNCGAAPPSPAPAAAPAVPPRTSVHVKFLKRGEVRGRKAAVARLACSARCGRVKAIVRRGRKVLGRGFLRNASAKQVVKVKLRKLPKRVRRALARGRLKVRAQVWVTPPGQTTTHAQEKLTLRKARGGRHKHGHR